MQPIVVYLVVARNKFNLTRRNNMRAFGLWILGVPVGVIILLAIFTKWV